MATLNLTFTAPINMSCKVGDTAYFVQGTEISSIGGFQVGGNVNLIGNINTITQSGSNIIINVELEGDNASIDTITTSSFILFSKNNLVELGSIKGYYNKVQFRNNSTEPAEMYATACEVEDSSD